MLEIEGRYNKAIVFTDKLDPSAIKQVEELCNQEFVQGSKIRIMPDAHSGVGCVIGTTMTLDDKVVPNLVGVDIGCGVEVAQLADRRLELQKLDDHIRRTIPSGFAVRSREHSLSREVDLTQLRCRKTVNLPRAQFSVGSLGGGNHFIEVNQDSEGKLYLAIHSGSRHLGLQVAQLYQRQAYRQLKARLEQELPSNLTKSQRNKLTKQRMGVPKALAYATGQLFQDYIHDMRIIQDFADINRQAMAQEIIQGMGLDVVERFSTVHNYIDTENMILRKGAVSAQKREKLIIPLNMRDGSLLCVGKGNPNWNYSAPHGAGRLMSRTQAKNSLSIDQYRELMEDVFTTSVNKGTLDECPLAYKPRQEIVDSIGETVEIVESLRSIYNFKAAE